MTATMAEPSLIPYIAVHDARAALDWYVDALGASVVGEPIVMPDGRVGHAELAIAGSTMYLSDDHPEIDVIGPVGRGGTTVALHLTVPQVDVAVDAAVRLGATLERPPADSPYGRTGTIRDPFGHRWMIQSPVGASAPTPIGEGDVMYFSLHVADLERAREFYAGVIGWDIAERSPDGPWADILGLSMHAGLWAGPVDRVPTPGVRLSHRVADIHAAVAKIQALGGTASEPRREAYGWTADCYDDQGNGFSLHESAADVPRIEGSRPGDISYITVSPGDEVAASRFYGELFGWEFQSGLVERGLQVDSTLPMTGFWGGEGRQTISLMFWVEDIEAAVNRVREFGGTASDPERQPYGLSSECVDDQGLAFYLHQP
jgi:predicted enzyme related to lactoylglutathione lyase